MDTETNVLPEDFDGVFRFTNFTEEDFTASWNKVAYTFPNNKTSPLIIPNETAEGIQSIRKKFAKELAVREFYKTDKFSGMNANTQGSHPALYTDSDLAPFIQRCLEPLPITHAKSTVVKEDVERVFTKDKKGEPRTKVLDPDESLVGQGTVIG